MTCYENLRKPVDAEKKIVFKKLESYFKWKAGEKVFKAPWVIKYYESVTDLKQFELGKIVENRLAIIIGVTCFIFGLMFGLILRGVI